MKRIEEYTKQLHTSVSNYWMQKASLWITQLCGKSGMGKTFLAQSYLEAYGGQYFSFRNLDAAFAPQIFRPGCKLWREFFAEIGETKNRPVIFFDDVDDRNDKEEFLNALPELAGKTYVVLIVRNIRYKKETTDRLEQMPICLSFFHKDPCSRRKSVHSEQSHQPGFECCSFGQPIPFDSLLSAAR